MTPLLLDQNFVARTKTPYSESERRRVLNLAKMEIDAYVIKYHPTSYNMKLTMDLVANQREYRLDATFRKPTKIQAFLSGQWVTLDRATEGVEYQLPEDEDTIKAAFSNSYKHAKYVIEGLFLTILSGKIDAVEDGLKLSGSGVPLDLTDLTDNTTVLENYAGAPNYTPGVPYSMLSVWITMACRIYKMEKDKGNTRDLDAEELAVYDLMKSKAMALTDSEAILLDRTQLNQERSRSDFGFEY